MSFEVIKPGPLSLLQDRGRHGVQHLGIGPSGAADRHAFAWACHLIGNSQLAAALEITLGSVRLLARATTSFALTGADLDARIDGTPLAPWCCHHIHAGQTLEFALPRSGLRAYLAVPGGFHAPAVYGSRATSVREMLGGLHGDGQPLKAGDVLAFDGAQVAPRCTPSRFIPDYRQELNLRLLPGYQFAAFCDDDIRQLLAKPFKVSTHSDRMGYRLEGCAIGTELPGIVSEGIAYGAVQVPPSGQPIVLLADRQTIGGYPKLGCVATQDASMLAQRMPGATLRFTLANGPELARERQQFEAFFAAKSGI